MTENAIKFLEDKKKHALEQAQVLVADNRTDEGILLKIRANVFGIFEDLAKGGHDAERLLAKIPLAWEKSLEQAIAHDDHIKIAQEKFKLDAIVEIRAFLEREEKYRGQGHYQNF